MRQREGGRYSLRSKETRRECNNAKGVYIVSEARRQCEGVDTVLEAMRECDNAKGVDIVLEAKRQCEGGIYSSRSKETMRECDNAKGVDIVLEAKRQCENTTMRRRYI